MQPQPSPSAGWCRVWLANCSAGRHFYKLLQRQIPLFRQISASESNMESIATWEKPLLQRSSGWWVAAGGAGDHVGCQPGQTWQLWRCLPSVVRDGRAARRDGCGKPAASGCLRRSWLWNGNVCEESSQALQSAVTWSCLWRPAKPISAGWMLHLSKLQAHFAFRVLTVTSRSHSEQHSSQHFLLPRYSGAFHYSPCRTSLNRSAFLQFISQTPRYTLILSFLIFAYPPCFEWYLNRGLFLKARTDLHVWLCQELLMKIPTSMGE